MQYLTVRQAAQYASCHPKTVANALREGALEGFQSSKGKHWKTTDEAVDRWVRG